MATISESANALNQGSSDVAALQLISLDQSVTFTQYVRYVLPLDGYVFWLRTAAMDVSGSLHVTIAKSQNEDETLAINKVVFSTGTAIQKFNDSNPNTIWVGTFHDIRFAFTRSDAHYQAAGLFHYVGDAVYPALANMLVDTGAQLPMSTLVVSNSLPLWLSLVTYAPVWLQPPNPLITLYPSFLVPDNLRAPYGVVHVQPDATSALSNSPAIGPVRPRGNAALGTINGTTLDSSHNQMASDRVKVTLYGATNQMALDFQDLVNQYSYDMDAMGIMNTPIMVDEKRTQPELGVIAMKKTIVYDVSYYQSRANAAARQLIQKAAVTIIPTY